jgi:hypothetical protein
MPSTAIPRTSRHHPAEHIPRAAQILSSVSTPPKPLPWTARPRNYLAISIGYVESLGRVRCPGLGSQILYRVVDASREHRNTHHTFTLLPTIPLYILHNVYISLSRFTASHHISSFDTLDTLDLAIIYLFNLLKRNKKKRFFAVQGGRFATLDRRLSTLDTLTAR